MKAKEEKDIGLLEGLSDEVLHGLEQQAEYILCRGG